MTSTVRVGGDLEVRRLGFGAMHLPAGPGPDRENALAVARRAVELGVTLIDTAHLYGGGANEKLLAEALYPYPEPADHHQGRCRADRPGRRPEARRTARDPVRLTPAQRDRLDRSAKGAAGAD